MHIGISFIDSTTPNSAKRRFQDVETTVGLTGNRFRHICVQCWRSLWSRWRYYYSWWKRISKRYIFD